MPGEGRAGCAIDKMIPKRASAVKDLKLGLNDLPEITIINREIERFKRVMLQNPTHEEEDSPRAVAERHILNGLERAREVLLLSYDQNPSDAAPKIRLYCRKIRKGKSTNGGKRLS